MLHPKRRMACFHGEFYCSAPQWADRLADAGIAAGANWTALDIGEIRSESGFGAVRRLTLSDGSRVYFKAECYAWRQRLKSWLRPLRTTIEVFAYGQMQRMDIPTLTTLGWGERRFLGLPLSSFVVTLEAPDSRDLKEFGVDEWQHLDEPRKSEIYQQLAGQLAQQLRVAHAHHFVHHDLKWRNVLVQPTSQGWRCIWIDPPRAAFWRVRLKRGRVVDLADLASLGVLLVSKYNRMRFIFSYLGAERRPGEAAALCRSIDRRLARRRSRAHELG